MTSLDQLARAVRSFSDSGFDYIELRADDVAQTSIELRDTSIDIISRKRESGHSARVLKKGRWGFAASDGVRDVRSTITAASKAAGGIARSAVKGSNLCPVEPVKRELAPRVRVPLDEVCLEDKVSYLARLCREVVKSERRVTAARASYSDITGDRYLVTSGGTEVGWALSHAYLRTSASGKESGRLAAVRDETATVTSGWEHFARSDPSEKIIERLVRKVRSQMDGVPCKRGTHPCVLSPRVTGMLAHEALGHLSEADLFSSAAFNGLQGTRVAPKGVTMVDSPKIKHGFGNIELDDEGVLPRKVTLIDDGILRDQMTNREWAERLDARPTGNARSENYRFPPIIRMRNTYIEPGDHSFEELVEGKKSGYYCVDVGGGMAESNSSFQVGIQECFEIVNGELGRPVRSLAISGVATESLAFIDGLGKDFDIESSYCGKFEQNMATSDGGPHLSLRKGGIVFGGSG